jgi:DNA-binding winged helix-turn-helix (wHTH) protein/tetratricopeptide (TPR) repeat protein
MSAGQNTTQERSSSRHRIGNFILDIERKELSKDGLAVKLRPQSFDALVHLVECRGRLVSKRNLIQKIWGSQPVSEDSLTHCILDIRKALGDVDKQFIRTVPRRGFILEIPVERAAPRTVPRTSWRTRRWAFGFMGVGMLAIAASAAFYFAAHTNDTSSHASLSAEHGTEAVDRYLRGRFLFNRRASGDLQSARGLFLKAVRREPMFAEAWAALAGTYAIEFAEGGYEDDRLLEKQRSAAERAILIDATLAEALVRLSGYYRVIGKYDIAHEYLDRAYAVGPDNPLLLGVMAGRYAREGDFELAITFQQRALDRDPLSFVHRRNLAYYLFASGRYEEALTENREVQQLYPATMSAPDELEGWILIQAERYQEARAFIQSWPDKANKHAAMAMVQFKLGNEDLAKAEMMQLKGANELEAHLRLAELFAFRNELDRSFAALSDLYRRAGHDTLTLQRHDLLNDINFSPFLAPLRADQRWDARGNGKSVVSVR